MIGMYAQCRQPRRPSCSVKFGEEALQAAEKVALIVIPNEVRNLSLFESREERDSSARSVPRNDNVLSFSANFSVERLEFDNRGAVVIAHPESDRRCGIVDEHSSNVRGMGKKIVRHLA